MQKTVEGRQGVPLNFLVPAVEGERVQVQRIHYCRRYALFWINEFRSLNLTHITPIQGLNSRSQTFWSSCFDLPHQRCSSS
jgi:hypothetical protein